MGKGKEKKKDKKDDKKDKKLSGAATTAAKTLKNDAKKAKKAGGGEGGDMQDLDALLNEFKKIDAKKTEITVSPCAAPGPRTHSSFLTSPVKDAEIVMFGGEFYNGASAFTYNELFRYNTASNEWLQVESPGGPPPRSSHQSVMYRDTMIVFGGEYSSEKQTNFHHYKV
jgi:hypothetical protein